MHYHQDNQDPYPIDSIGGLIAAAVREHCNNTGVEPALAAVAAMSSAAAAVQVRVDVQRPDAPPSPVGTLNIVCAASGAGKSTAAKPFLQPHKEVQEALEREAPSAVKRRAEYKAWLKSLEAQLELRAQKAASGETDTKLEDSIAEHRKREPQGPVHLLHDRVTPNALTRSLASFPSTLIASLDAGHVLSGKLMGEFDLLLTLWDGDDVRLDTLEDSVRARNPRASALLYTQPGVLLRFMKRRAEEADDTGFFARVECTFLPHAQIRPTLTAAPVYHAMKAFQNRAQYFLNDGVAALRHRRFSRRSVGFTRDAAAYFHDLFRRTVVMGAPAGQLRGLGGYAAKMAERVARYACVIHVYNDLPGLISAETLARAEAIVQWHTRQFQHMRHEASPQTLAAYDAQVLENYLQRALQQGESLMVRDLQRFCPADWERKRCSRALRALEDFGRACVRPHNHNTKYIQLTYGQPGLRYGGRSGYLDAL
ncbi:DUF3987 domain-containing protein [Xenophilus sp. Marseille-Q4582]|uniref:DUF3987 domain-containing protein n=1 Tax=Xenophilus sp. Marseille-Q4582 TaxID=2866600 RepID=UPI001CE491B6|nr:DUF3987 domain-containing protein [Xenophilus sp. Marseille-Q4582]